MAKIFVNYRRDDDPSAAARVRDGLAAKFGKSNVFMDVDNLLAGQRFDKELDKALAQCDVLVSIIGPRWMDVLRERAASPDRDYVREEIAAALKRGILVVPVRVGREGRLAPLPLADDLPEDIRDLVLHQKHDVTHERYGRDVADLAEAIDAVRHKTNPARRWIKAGAAIAAVAAAIGTIAWIGPSQLLERLPIPSGRASVSPIEVREAINLLNAGQLAVYIDRGWNPNTAVDGDGNAALHWLMEVCEKHKGHDQGKLRDIAMQLITAGADKAQENKFNNTPGFIAKSPKYCGPDHPVNELFDPQGYAKHIRAKREAADEAETKRKGEESKVESERQAAALAALGTPAAPSDQSNRVSYFTFQTSPTEIDPGLRIWKSEKAGWTETWPSGHRTRSKFRGRLLVDGCNGTAIEREDEPNLYAFIPDKDCPTLIFRFRRGTSGPWIKLATMNNVR